MKMAKLQMVSHLITKLRNFIDVLNDDTAAKPQSHCYLNTYDEWHTYCAFDYIFVLNQLIQRHERFLLSSSVIRRLVAADRCCSSSARPGASQTHVIGHWRAGMFNHIRVLFLRRYQTQLTLKCYYCCSLCNPQPSAFIWLKLLQPRNITQLALPCF